MDRPTVLMPKLMPRLVLDGLDGHVTMVKLWESSDSDATLAEAAAKIGAIATSGHDCPIDADLMGRLPKLDVVVNFGVGYDHIDVGWAAEHGVTVTHTPGILDDEVADTALGLILATVRQFPAAERHLRAGRWPLEKFRLSSSLRGRTLGILGLGRIGKAIAKRGEAFGLTVVYHNRRPVPNAPYLYYPTLLGLAQACDILVVATPGGTETRNLIGTDVFRALGPQGVLINIARGTIVDEEALAAALRDGTILSAGLDVFSDEPNVPQGLIDIDHAVLLPHVGSASRQTRDAMWQLVVDNVLSWARGTGPLTPVPETPWLKACGLILLS